MWWLFVFLCVALILVTIKADIFCFKAEKKIKFSGINYDSCSANKTLRMYKELKGASASGPVDISISFKMKIYSIGESNNVFQTAPGNVGLRLELTKPSTAALVWTCSQDCLSDDGLKGSVISKTLELNKWYTVSIILKKSKHLKVLFDNQVVYNNDYQFLIEFSDIAVGTGFSKTRDFDGAIKDFIIQYNIYTENKDIIRFLPLFRVFVFLGAGVLILFWILQQRNKISTLRFKWQDFLHPVFIGAFPILFLFSVNLNEVLLFDIMFPLNVLLPIIVVFVLLCSFLLRDSGKAAVIADILIIMFFSTGRLFEIFTKAGIRIAPIDFCCGIIIGTVFLLRWVFLSKEDFTKVTPFLNIFSSILIIITFSIIGSYYVKKNILQLRIKEEIIVSSSGVIGPDIYYIILDGYGSSAILREFYSYDNSEFESYLANKNFFVTLKSTSNYQSTQLSIPSSLNMKYINDSNNILTEDILNNNSVAQFLKRKGYKFITLNSNKVLVSRNIFADLDIDCSFRPFLTLLFKTTILFCLEEKFDDLHRNAILDFFIKLPEITKVPGPKFIYAHLLCPHPPYLFGLNGEHVDIAMRKKIISNDAGLPIDNKNLYVDQLRYVNKRIRSVIEKILALSERDPIIILQGDHRPRLYLIADTANGLLPRLDCLRSRFGIFNAYYLPGGNSGLYSSITPVNSFRLILNRYFQAGLPMLTDKNYYSTDPDPYSFTDVTDMLKYE